MKPFERLADRFTLVFYDHRCNGRGGRARRFDDVGEPDGRRRRPRERLGFETWSVLGHSFGGQVALEYARRYRRKPRASS